MTINGCVNKASSIEQIHVFLTTNNIKFNDNVNYFCSFSIAHFEKFVYYKDVKISIQKSDSMHIFYLHILVFTFALMIFFNNLSRIYFSYTLCIINSGILHNSAMLSSFPLLGLISLDSTGNGVSADLPYRGLSLKGSKGEIWF